MRRWQTVLILSLSTAVIALGNEQGGAEHGPSMLLKWVNFAILAGLFGYMIAKMAPAFFKGRDEEIQRDLREAAEMKRSAEAKTADIEKRLATLDSEIETIRVGASKELEVERLRIERETEAALQKLEHSAALEIESTTKTAVAELKSYSAKLALELAETKIRGQINADTEGRLINGFLKRLN